MVNLRELNLSGCNLSGPIPESIGNLTKLETLCLANNNFTGPIPDSLGRLQELRVLRLSFNKLTGKQLIKGGAGVYSL